MFRKHNKNTAVQPTCPHNPPPVQSGIAALCPEQPGVCSVNNASLAFLGDAVFGLMVREALVNRSNRPAGKLHEESVRLVNACAQAHAAQLLLPELTQEELDVYKRGRNTHLSHTPKNQSSADYHSATGLECLFGYLYLNGSSKRLRELFAVIIEGELIEQQ